MQTDIRENELDSFIKQYEMDLRHNMEDLIGSGNNLAEISHSDTFSMVEKERRFSMLVEQLNCIYGARILRAFVDDATRQEARRRISNSNIAAKELLKALNQKESDQMALVDFGALDITSSSNKQFGCNNDESEAKKSDVILQAQLEMREALMGCFEELTAEFPLGFCVSDIESRLNQRYLEVHGWLGRQLRQSRFNDITSSEVSEGFNQFCATTLRAELVSGYNDRKGDALSSAIKNIGTHFTSDPVHMFDQFCSQEHLHTGGLGSEAPNIDSIFSRLQEVIFQAVLGSVQGWLINVSSTEMNNYIQAGEKGDDALRIAIQQEQVFRQCVRYEIRGHLQFLKREL